MLLTTATQDAPTNLPSGHNDLSPLSSGSSIEPKKIETDLSALSQLSPRAVRKPWWRLRWPTYQGRAAIPFS